MPEQVKSSWADEVDDEPQALPAPTEKIKGGVKTVTEYQLNDQNKRVKIVRTFKMERRIVSKTIAIRKNWKKFGNSSSDKPGPDPATTLVAEDVFMQFITNKEGGEQDKQEEDVFDKLRNMDQGMVKCRNCKGEHWTSKCPYKDTMSSASKPDDKKPTIPGTSGLGGDKKVSEGKYVPPSMRDGAKHVDSMSGPRRDDTLAIRISNLSESTQDTDLEDLVKPFGPYSKLYLAKDRHTNTCKGFAYVHFKFKADAAKAIAALNGFGYDHLILNVDWSKPAAN